MAGESNPFTVLLEKARRGDRDAAEELARTYEPDLRIAARVLLGPLLRPYLDSVDLVQSVHRTLMTGLHDDKLDVATPDALVRLAVTIVRRKVATKWRKLRRQQRLSGTTPAGELADLLCGLGGATPDPSREAQNKEAVEAACRQLNDKERRLIELRLQGYKTNEAADLLDEDPDVTRVRLSRLRRKLHKRGVFADW